MMHIYIENISVSFGIKFIRLDSNTYLTVPASLAIPTLFLTFPDKIDILDTNNRELNYLRMTYGSEEKHFCTV